KQNPPAALIWISRELSRVAYGYFGLLATILPMLAVLGPALVLAWWYFGTVSAAALYAGWGGALLGVSMNALGARTALKGPEVVHVKVTKQGLPAALSGFRIVQISDLHISDRLGIDYVEKVVSKVAGLNADLIAITGDLVDGKTETLNNAVGPLASL